MVSVPPSRHRCCTSTTLSGVHPFRWLLRNNSTKVLFRPPAQPSTFNEHAAAPASLLSNRRWLAVSTRSEIFKDRRRDDMTTIVQEVTRGGGLRLAPTTRTSDKNPQAWTALVGTKPVSARFALLPESEPKMSALGTSVIIQICLVTVVVILPLLFPQQMIPRAMDMVTNLAGPPLDLPEPPKPKAPAPPKMAKVQPTPPPPIVRPAPPKMDVAKYFAPPKMEPPKVKPRQVEADLPKVNDTFQPLTLKVDASQPARPREPVKTGLMTSGSQATPTITKPTPVEKVQTGGFGDPQGVAGPSNPNKRANVGQFGNPALPPGPGYGNGSGGANGQRGIVASTGFGNGVAIEPSGGARGRGGSVQTFKPPGSRNTNDQRSRPNAKEKGGRHLGGRAGRDLV